MASNEMPRSDKVQSLEDMLTCPICIDSLQDPRTLACLHTFCTVCLTGCLKHHRRDFECPVCKRLTSLSVQGIQGLPIDHRIQQIRDIVNQSMTKEIATVKVSGGGAGGGNQSSCDLCRSQQRRAVSAICHCIQCFMYFCDACAAKHRGNALFAGHDTISMRDSSAVETLFCRQHPEHPVRYFCKTCRLLLCTVCTIDHDADHRPEALERGVIERYRRSIDESIVALASKLKDVKTKAKCLETLRQTQQGALYKVQAMIRERADGLVARIRDEESHLLTEAQNRFDDKMRTYGMERLTEMTFFRSSAELLYDEMQLVLAGSPQACLLRHDDLMNRFSSISETSVPAVGRHRCDKTISFVPSSDVELVIGSLQEISVNDDGCRLDGGRGCGDDDNGMPLTTGMAPGEAAFASLVDVGADPAPQPSRNRAILNAVAPTRNSLRIGKIKSVNRPNQTNDAADNRTNEGGRSVDAPNDSAMEQPRSSSSTTPPSSPSSTTTVDAATASPPPPAKRQLLFSVEQIGGLPGKITSPSSVAFLPNGNVVVAECEHRLQVFDRTGQSVRIIGWGKIRPQSVVVTPTGLIACTDKKEQTVKIYKESGELCESWPSRMLGMPSGIAVSPSGFFVVSDVDQRLVTTHSPRGNVVATVASWSGGLGVQQRFASPTHVAVDRDDNVFVTDALHSVQMFDKTGKHVRRFALPAGASGTWHSPFRPQGLCVGTDGSLAVCDHDNHRISLFAPDGGYVGDLLTERDGLKYPCDVAISATGTEIAVVESHTGILTNNPHYSVKVFSATT